VSVLMSALVLWPAFQDPRDDSFPLSTFPMFSRPKPDPGLVVTQVLAVFPDGRHEPLPPELATGNEEVIQTLRMIRDQVYKGKGRRKRFCADVAKRVSESDDATWLAAHEVVVAKSLFDTVAYFEEGPTPITRKTLEKCAIPR